jgi:hypothetical protein
LRNEAEQCRQVQMTRGSCRARSRESGRKDQKFDL